VWGGSVSAGGPAVSGVQIRAVFQPLPPTGVELERAPIKNLGLGWESGGVGGGMEEKKTTDCGRHFLAERGKGGWVGGGICYGPRLAGSNHKPNPAVGLKISLRGKVPERANIVGRDFHWHFTVKKKFSGGEGDSGEIVKAIGENKAVRTDADKLRFGRVFCRKKKPGLRSPWGRGNKSFFSGRLPAGGKFRR